MFKPTYKYVEGKDEYTPAKAKGARTPAWCDRILYRQKEEVYQKLDLIEYNTSNDIKISDHRPVYGLFVAQIVKVSEEKQEEVKQ